MKKILFSFVLGLFIQSAQASEHHSGHVGMGSGSSAGSCTKAHISKFKPAHLETTKPETEFSFVAFNINKPELINVTVKNQPVDIETEFKDPFYIVKGKLPAGLSNTAARINVKITGKVSSCDMENGWLIKIE
jgi:hypothetical protein